jgi:hypothetical protein
MIRKFQVFGIGLPNILSHWKKLLSESELGHDVIFSTFAQDLLVILF